MRKNSGKDKKARRNRMKGATAVVVATALAVTPIAGLTLADGEAFGGKEGAAAVIEKVQNARIAGASAVVKYLNGGSLSLEELNTIDLGALRSIDPATADNIASAKAKAQAAAAEKKAQEEAAKKKAAEEAAAKAEADKKAQEEAAAKGETVDPDPDNPAPIVGPDSKDPDAVDPTEPGEGEDPVDPADPTDPVDPVDPTDPAEPVDPSEPGEGEDPTDPTDPGDAEDPKDPVDPADPSKPAEPTDPSKPADPDATDPKDPADDAKPADPADPKDPDAADPSTPAEPEAPADEPAAPAEPVAPTIPTPPAPVTPADPPAAQNPSYPSWSYNGNTAYTPKHYSHDLTTEKFIAVIGEQAREIGQERDLYASVMIAQAILESASGNSLLAKAPNNNLFGIKGTYNGESVLMRTAEDDGTGLIYFILSDFRKYDTVKDSLNDYADLMCEGLNGFYAPVWKSNAPTFVDATDYLEGRYATDTQYSEKLQDIIATYDLTRFDEPLDYETVSTFEFPVIDEETGKEVLDPITGEVVMEQRTLADLVAEATSHLGTPYLWGGVTPDGFDCSGLVQYCYREVLGVEIPRTTYFQCLVGEDVDFEDLHMGDLLFFDRASDGVGHVAMYLGDGYYIQAPHTGDVVKVTAMEDQMPTFAKRVIETRPVTDQLVTDLVEDPLTPAGELFSLGKDKGSAKLMSQPLQRLAQFLS
ncbi:glucosaminidase domain-containing protein [Adlercreutzia faecimuris]|uniref:NlpC/P60 family protein n=1 Tax=Adlercreutzia faecimuris TaxID=2897341 RepID=A0ABS9WEQ0_9ACTN|nr:glucosaminidase domain-containing protein [Adlercreutzia sp. JBNU-10]MCI2240772.1 NlpC/P60 family protein [Adlercreutzia sp. JBNU-10]